MLPNLRLVRLTLMLAVLSSLILSSCTTQKAIYFVDVPDSTKGVSIGPAEYKEPVIQPDDILSITIQSIDLQAPNALMQATQATGSGSGSPVSQSSVSGFLVDKNGFVDIPMLGEMKLSGLTTEEARKMIRDKASKYYRNLTVQVRFANFKITVIGEVGKPATYTVPNEKITIIDAIGMAGDLTIYGKRDNVMLIRFDSTGNKKIVRLDLTSSGLLQSPYFYLAKNDVIYVEPSKAKVAVNNSNKIQALGIGLSLVTLFITIITRF